ncbi:MAG: histidine kinase [Eubacteriales bacterium]|nr:histidine kinase [Eubacteriales bacterium]
MKNIIKKIRDYTKTHIGVSVTLSVIVLLLTAMLILQSYVKNQYFDYLLEQTDRTERAVLDSSTTNINNMLQDIVETGCSIAVDSTLRNTVKTAKELEGARARKEFMLKEQLSLMTHYSNNIAAVAIVNEDGLLQEYGRYWAASGYANLWTGESLETLQNLYKDVMELLDSSSSIRYCVSEEPFEHESMPKARLFHLALPLVGRSSNWSAVTDVVVVTFRLDSIVSDSMQIGYVTGREGTILYHEDEQFQNISAEEYLAQRPEYIDISRDLDYFNWTAHITIDTEGMHERVNQMYQGSILLYLFLLFVCGIIWQFALQKILRPVGEIREAMHDIRLGSPRKKIEIKGSHEIWQLASDYNSMLDSLHQQQEEIDRHYREKTMSIKQKNRAEREALESQINAHFLCNTLTAINYNAIEAGNYEVATLLKKMSSMLAYSFSKGYTSITLGQEIKWVEEYLYLQKFRLMEVFDYRIEFPSEYSEWPSCKLFLQPFVENSILHGFEGRESGGLIVIKGCPDGKRFKISISDNGCGMEPGISSLIQQVLGEPHVLELNGCGIGIQNAVTRLRMYFGKELSITLETAPGEGTCFTFWLPLGEHPGEDFSE